MSTRPRKATPTRTTTRQKDEPGVEQLLDALAHPQRPLIDALRALVAKAVPTATESVKWNSPSFATGEHFATLHLRSKQGVLLVLHLGTSPRPEVDMREAVSSPLLEWKGPSRAIVTVADAGHLKAVRRELARVIKAWSACV